jgi:hypothetical protein
LVVTLLPRWALLSRAVVKLEGDAVASPIKSRASVEPHSREINWQFPESPFQNPGVKGRAASGARPLQVPHAKVRQGPPFCPSGRIGLYLPTMDKKRHAMFLLDICLILAVLVYLIISFMLR